MTATNTKKTRSPYAPMSPTGRAKEKLQSSFTPAAAANAIDILTAMTTRQLYGGFFSPPSSWFSWHVLLAAAFALPIERTGHPEAAMKLFTHCTGRTVWPTKQAKTLAITAGVRSGKSRIAAFIANYLACFRDYSRYLAPGERGYLPVIAADRKQARVVFSYTAAFASGSELLKETLEEEMKERLVFAHGIDIEVMTGNFRAVRGYSMIGAVLDECAYYRSDDSSNPDDELLQSIRRGTLTIPNAMIVLISSPYARRGILWDTYRQYWGVDDSPTFVWKSPTWVLNRTITREDLEPEFQRDPEKARADYGAEFRRDVERFVASEVLDACIDKSRFETAPANGVNYVAFTDPSGGSGDSMTLAIGHREGDITVIDAVYEWLPPFSPDQVVSEAATYVKRYGLSTVIGDKYAGLWPEDRFSAYDITYEAAKKSKSDLYVETLPLMNSQRLRLPDNQRLRQQFFDLERRTSRTGRDIIDHPPKSHDDVANSVAGCAAFLQDQLDIELTWGR